MMYYILLKRLFDLLVSGVMLAILSPLLAGIVVAIRLTGGGPAIFRQERAGKNGRPFTLCKFRTMRLDVDPFGTSPRSRDDPRLTRVGRFLRAYSLDELPQLANILRGDMSLVGPRPLYVSQIAEWDERQRKRLLVRPGLTGLAQIFGRGGLTCEEKLELDVKYVEQASLGLDARIFLATFVRVLARKGIYEKRYSRSECTRGQARANRKE
jgi:lipopolysaccharide/colanic/teichoic acid biosynthesis glycosyltransferase